MLSRIHRTPPRWSGDSISAGRGAKKLNAFHTSTSSLKRQPPLPPFDYNFPFGNPSLLIPTASVLAALKKRDENSLEALPPPPPQQYLPISPFYNPEAFLEEDADLVSDEVNEEAFELIREEQAVHEVADEDLQQEFPDQDIRQPEPEDIAFTQEAPEVAPHVTHFSDQIHILGNDIKAHYLAHSLCALAGAPPIRLLLHRHFHLRTWHEAGRRIRLFRHNEHTVARGRIIPELIGYHNHDLTCNDHIEQLIVTIPCAVTLEAMKKIAHRIDNQTTILLIQDGLGTIEVLNRHVFPDSRIRPHYILGHMTHILGQSNKQHYTLKELQRGKLVLAAWDSYFAAPVKKAPPVERRRNQSHFLSLLTLTPELGAGGYNYAQFLQRKIPDMIFRAVVDPVCAVLNMSYQKLVDSEHGRSMCKALITEIQRVVAEMPELQDSPSMLAYVQSNRMWKDCRARLLKRTRIANPMTARVKLGMLTDIDYFNGYFVRRGQRLGIRCPANVTIIGLLKAKQRSNNAEMMAQYPYGGFGPPVPFVHASGTSTEFAR